jgi:hypothetical protein
LAPSKELELRDDKSCPLPLATAWQANFPNLKEVKITIVVQGTLENQDALRCGKCGFPIQRLAELEGLLGETEVKVKARKVEVVVKGIRTENGRLKECSCLDGLSRKLEGMTRK